MISLIVAYDLNQGIGIKNKLPWKLSDDLKFFKETTLDKPIIMGRKTFQSIGKPLPHRRNIILSQQPDLSYNNCEVYTSIEAALNHCKNEDEIVIIGGATIYKQSLNLVDRMYITEVQTKVTADAFFPDWDITQWKLINSVKKEANESNEYDFKITIWDKIKN